MGSLMAGWDSHVLDDDRASLERNRSLTKEEIDTFWRSHKKIEGEEGNDSPTAFGYSQSSKECQLEKRLQLKSNTRYQMQKSRTFPGRDILAIDEEEGKKKANKTGDWWTRSNWAFLNEPPVDENASSHKYAAQYHVAELAAKEH